MGYDLIPRNKSIDSFKSEATTGAGSGIMEDEKCEHCRYRLNSDMLPILSRRYNRERQLSAKMARQANHYAVLYQAAKAAIEQLRRVAT